jgi:hypothetical protein
MAVLWVVTACRLVEICRRFGGTYGLCFQAGENDRTARRHVRKGLQYSYRLCFLCGYKPVGVQNCLRRNPDDAGSLFLRNAYNDTKHYGIS